MDFTQGGVEGVSRSLTAETQRLKEMLYISRAGGGVGIIAQGVRKGSADL